MPALAYAVEAFARRRSDWRFALACLTRYEAWPVTVSALAAAGWTLWRRGRTPRQAIRCIGAIAVYPAVAIAGFAIFSRVVIGQWFVACDFFVPENKALGDWALAAKEIGWGAAALSGSALTWIGGIGAGCAARAGRDAGGAAPPRPSSLSLGTDGRAAVGGVLSRPSVPDPLHGAADRHRSDRRRHRGGHRAEAARPGVCRRGARRDRWYELRPLDAHAPMVVEAQWDRPNLAERARVTACIGRLEPGEKIMASMGSLGHYMQEASRAGLAIRDFLHEGNGDIWLAALQQPQPYAAWMLIEEKAEGGDMLAKIARERPGFLAGYERVCDGAGLALYRRTPSRRPRTVAAVP